MKMKAWKIIFPALFAASFFLCAFPFWQIGTEGFDSVYYQWMGLQWARGKWGFTCPGGNQINFFRPLYFAVSALFYQIFGIHDYTLKIINLASLAVLTWLLLLTARQLKIRPPFSYFPAIFFLFLPATITQSRIESPHLLSAVFTTLAFFLLLQFRSHKRTSHLLYSALALHAAMATHEELALLAPGFLGLLLLDACREDKTPLRTFLRQAALFSAAFFAPFLFYFMLWKPREIIATFQFLQTFAPRGIFDSEKHFPIMAVELLTARLSILIGIPWTFFLYSHLAGQLLGFLKKYEPIRGASILVPLFVYGILLDLLLTRNNTMRLVRLMIPLLPFLGLYFAVQIQGWCRREPSRTKSLAVAGLVLFATISNFKGLPKIPSFSHYNWDTTQPFYRYKTVFRLLHDQLKGKVGKEQKVLIAPGSFYDPYDAFNLPFYFNGQAISLNRCAGGKMDLETFLRENHIRFVFVGKTNLSSVREGGASCLVPEGPYSEPKETAKLLEALAPYQPVKMDFEDSYGMLFEIKISEERNPGVT